MLLQAGRERKKSWLLHFWKHKAFVFSFTTLLGAGQSKGVQPLTPVICTDQQTQGLCIDYHIQNNHCMGILVGAE